MVIANPLTSKESEQFIFENVLKITNSIDNWEYFKSSSHCIKCSRNRLSWHTFAKTETVSKMGNSAMVW